MRQYRLLRGTPALLCRVAFLMTACGGPASIAAPAAVICGPGSEAEVSVVYRDLEEGERDLQRGNFEQAIRAFRAGVDKLGNGYARPRVLDDTGQRLGRAGVEERQGRASVAAHLLRNTLSSRLSLCAMKLEDTSSPALIPHHER